MLGVQSNPSIGGNHHYTTHANDYANVKGDVFDYEEWRSRVQKDVNRADKRLEDYLEWLDNTEEGKEERKRLRLLKQREAAKFRKLWMFGDKHDAAYDAESFTELYLDPETGYPDCRPDDFKSTSLKHAKKAFNQTDENGEPNHYLYVLNTMQHYGLAELYNAKITAEMLNLPPKYEYWRNFEDNETKNAWKNALKRVFPLAAGGIEVGRYSFKTHAHLIFDMRQVKDKNILAAAADSKNFKRITSEESLLGAYCYFRKEKLHFPTEALPDRRQFTYWVEAKQERHTTGERRAPSTWKWGIPKLEKVLSMSHDAVPNRIVTPGIWNMARANMESYISGDNREVPSVTCAKWHLENFPDAKPDMFLDNPEVPYNVATLTSYIDFCRVEVDVFAESIRYVNFSKKPGKEKTKRFQTFIDNRPKYYLNLKRRINYKNLYS